MLVIWILFHFFLFPVFGLLGDLKTGRYKMIITGVYFSFASWITFDIAAIINVYINIDVLYWSVLGLGYFPQVIGHSMLGCTQHYILYLL